QRANAIGMAQHDVREGLLERAGGAHSSTKRNAGPAAQSVGEFDSRVSDGRGGGGNRELADAIEILEPLLWRKVLRGIEDRRRGDVRVWLGRVERDFANGRLAFHE